MNKLTEKLKNKVHRFVEGTDHQPQPQAVAQPPALASSEQVLYRYRKQLGVNLGSWFVLERWIAETPFRNAAHPAQSDLDVARGSDAKRIFEEHWDIWITESDFQFIVDRGFNTVRLPIGYYHLCGLDKNLIRGTDFEDFYDVFAGAWPRIQNAISTAYKHGLGVLLDLHAAPGKQNHDAHAGTSKEPRFFKDSVNESRCIEILQTLILNTRQYPNIVGIEIVNEPAPPSDHSLKSFYTRAIKSLRAIEPSLPIYIGECWKPDDYAGYIESSHLGRPGSMIVLDHHLYRCFTKADISTAASAHASSLLDPNAYTPKLFASLSSKLASHGGLIIGEWSGALNPGSLRGEPNEQKKWIEAQLQLFNEHCAGWFFWTFKKQQPGDHGWSLVDSWGGRVFPDSVGLRRKRDSCADAERIARAREDCCNQAYNQHVQYWSQYPGVYAHELFRKGYGCGWNDAYLFFESSSNPKLSVPEIGFRGTWMRSNIDHHIQGFWEYEHGYNQGVNAARCDFEKTYC